MMWDGSEHYFQQIFQGVCSFGQNARSYISSAKKYVAQYKSKFAELTRFARHMVQDEIMKVRKFESGLRPTILGELVALQLQSYSETVERACLVEEEMLDSQSTYNRGSKVRRERDSTRLHLCHLQRRAKGRFSIW